MVDKARKKLNDHNYYIRHKKEARLHFREYVKKHPLYRVYVNMMLRCGHWTGGNKQNVEDYCRRGITVCETWKKFRNFEPWAIANGWRKGLVIDRIDNDKGYCPENCRFITQAENLLNRRNTIHVIYKGKKIRLYEIWAKSDRIVSYKVFNLRVRQLNWEIDLALNTPNQRSKEK